MASPAALLLDELGRLGVSIEARAGRLHLRPAARVSTDLRARLVACKPALLAVLASPRLQRPAWATDPSWRPTAATGWTEMGCGLWCGPNGELTTYQPGSGDPPGARRDGVT